MKYLILCDVFNKWRWCLDSPEGERLATGEGYASRAECEAAIALTKSADGAPVELHPRFREPSPEETGIRRTGRAGRSLLAVN